MKRVLMLAACFACLSFAGGLFAQAAEGETPKEEPKKEEPKKDEPKKEEGRRPGGRTMGDREIGRIRRTMDKNQDQKITKDEFGNDKLFDEIDADKSGDLSTQEMTAAKEKVLEEVKRQAKAAAEEEFNALDRNSDKKLSAEELGDARKDYIESDKNKDGSLDLDEYVEAKGKAATAAANKARDEEMKKLFEDQWKTMDKDGDGKLAGDEIPERMKKNLDKIDTDKDGAISKSEMEAVMKAAGGQRPGGRRPGGEQPKKEGETPKKEGETPKKEGDKPKEDSKEEGF
jgi:Ca2+-binding EF-hand superfamily protein